MKVFIDEDCGTGIPKSLRLVKAPCAELIYPHKSGPVAFGTKDYQWIPWAGDNGYLVLSMNHRILENPNEFDLLIKHSLGIVFVDYGSYAVWEVLRMFMNRWGWFEEIDRSPKPFVYLAGLTGKPAAYDLALGPRPPRPYRAPRAQTAPVVPRSQPPSAQGRLPI